jgi:hypothetical protein
MGRTYRTHHPKFSPGNTVNLRSYRRSLPFQRDDAGYITSHDQLLTTTRKNVEHYDSSGTLYANATDALQGDRFYVEQGDNGFRFKETETGKYLALKGEYVFFILTSYWHKLTGWGLVGLDLMMRGPIYGSRSGRSRKEGIS